jgi:predicted small lipoprotein YifL
MLAAAILVLVVALTGCGSKKKSSTPPVATTTAAEVTTTAATTTTTATTTSTSTSGFSSIATAGNCKQLSDLSASFSKAITGAKSDDFATRAKLLKDFADKTPSDIRPDFEVLAATFSKYADAFKGITIKPGQVPDAATLVKLQKLTSSINQASVTQASAHISAWAQKNCTHS